MTSTGQLFVAVLVLILAFCWSHPAYQTYIPNGNLVPHPCNASEIWTRVGHVSQTDTTNQTKTQFGLDFSNAKLNYTAATAWGYICGLDSDNDGLTNGQELGDTNCTWTYPNSFPSANNLSHPGFDDDAYRTAFC